MKETRQQKITKYKATGIYNTSEDVPQTECVKVLIKFFCPCDKAPFEDFLSLILKG